MSEQNMETDGENVDGAQTEEVVLADGSKARQPFTRKRRAEPASEAEIAELHLKRFRERLAAIPRSQINAIQLLNEYTSGVDYQFSAYGPVHESVFTAKLTVDGLVFEGTANTKKKAKLLAAEAALNALFSDILSQSDSATGVNKLDGGDIESTNIVAEGGIVGTHPTQVLLRLRPGIKFFGEEPEPFNFTTPTGTVTTTPLYRVSVTVDAVKFYGSGASKKLAKARAAAEALQKAFSISCTETPNGFPIFVGEIPSTKTSKVDSSCAVPPEPVAMPQLLCSLPNEKNPIMMLHELYPSAEFTCDETKGGPGGIFNTSITIENTVFQGQGTSKKQSRTCAAINAINYLHESGYLSSKLTEQISRKINKPKWQGRKQFSQSDDSGTTGIQFRGGGGAGRARGRGRGVGRGRGGAGRPANWIAGGVLTAGDVIGVGQSKAEQDYPMNDDSFVTANSSFGYSASDFSSSPFIQKITGINQSPGYPTYSNVKPLFPPSTSNSLSSGSLQRGRGMSAGAHSAGRGAGGSARGGSTFGSQGLGTMPKSRGVSTMAASSAGRGAGGSARGGSFGLAAFSTQSSYASHEGYSSNGNQSKGFTAAKKQQLATSSEFSMGNTGTQNSGNSGNAQILKPTNFQTSRVGPMKKNQKFQTSYSYDQYASGDGVASGYGKGQSGFGVADSDLYGANLHESYADYDYSNYGDPGQGYTGDGYEVEGDPSQGYGGNYNDYYSTQYGYGSY